MERVEHTNRKAIRKEVLEENYINWKSVIKITDMVCFSCTYFKDIEILHNTLFQFSSKF